MKPQKKLEKLPIKGNQNQRIVIYHQKGIKKVMKYIYVIYVEINYQINII